MGITATSIMGGETQITRKEVYQHFKVKQIDYPGEAYQSLLGGQFNGGLGMVVVTALAVAGLCVYFFAPAGLFAAKAQLLKSVALFGGCGLGVIYLVSVPAFIYFTAKRMKFEKEEIGEGEVKTLLTEIRQRAFIAYENHRSSYPVSYPKKIENLEPYKNYNPWKDDRWIHILTTIEA